LSCDRIFALDNATLTRGRVALYYRGAKGRSCTSSPQPKNRNARFLKYSYRCFSDQYSNEPIDNLSMAFKPSVWFGWTIYPVMLSASTDRIINTSCMALVNIDVVRCWYTFMFRDKRIISLRMTRKLDESSGSHVVCIAALSTKLLYQLGLLSWFTLGSAPMTPPALSLPILCLLPLLSLRHRPMRLKRAVA